MEKIIINKIIRDTKLKQKQIETTLSLLQEGNTVPFIARYRKEMTGNLDEEQIRLVEKEYVKFEKLEIEKEKVFKRIVEKEMMTPELEKSIKNAETMQILDDIYLPFKEKKKTKATEAIKNGLEPLAKYILENGTNIEEKSQEFINDKIKNSVLAIEGALHIISEKISEKSEYREFIRKYIWKNGILEAKAKKDALQKDEKKRYEIYYDFKQEIKKLPSYRILAINRCEKEKVISVKITYNEEEIIEFISNKEVVNLSREAKELIEKAISDALSRLIIPAIKREVRKILTNQGQEEAIKIFGTNLEKLIMQKPLKDKWILSLDPAFRTGCKFAVINDTSKMEEVGVIFPHQPVNKIKESEEKIKELINKFPISQIVIGNGTASRETEEFIDNMNLKIPYSLISEAGASVYSASKIAQEEFPDLTVEYRSAISIARRIQDPMAELVKIDPKAIGVGQYQHDVNQKELAEYLDFILLKSINQVGIDINTASKELLKYVSGLDKTLAQNIVEYRQENGKYTNRNQLKKVKRLGNKAFTQSAGFLKILDGDNFLDSTFVHPDDYTIALEIKERQFEELNSQDQIKEEKIKVSEKFNITTDKIEEIESYLNKPDLDVRTEIVSANFSRKIRKIEDLKIGDIVQGEIRNIVQFGAFVDIGLKNDALVHISEISKKFLKNVTDVLELGMIKDFKIKDIDIEKGKIQLSLKELE